ncbi:ABC transporter substrate-binding protein [Paenibacillus hunanensis]|uniref:ABC transporter substrate-binding protein n=1 Tax=Paenibacillus hunanensis TaxID=539262 RepID=UPI002A6B155F|nr:ABC transporter substrate-binding protein [Paenibacillus hunanensis]WPP40700.1 ABC transporter substrate-binding protein [Paenibacillus hunanensis]
MNDRNPNYFQGKRQHRVTGLLSLILILAVTAMLAACGNSNNGASNTSGAASNEPTASTTGTSTDEQTHTITYLGKTYTVPVTAKRIVITGSMEAMEDALSLDVHPVGAITYRGKFPEKFASITGDAQSIGEKTEPNFETILSLKPDIILGTTKFDAPVLEQLNKIAPTIPVSHISDNWQDNLKLMGELSGKLEQAETAISTYENDIAKGKQQLGARAQEETVLAVRIRQGTVYVYPSNVFVNAALYEDLGLKIPELIQQAKAQQEISIEQLAQLNPDHLFIQFSEDENADTPEALTNLQNNPIFNKTKASQNGHVYVNVIDPLSEGGPAWSRDQFLQAAVKELTK